MLTRYSPSNLISVLLIMFSLSLACMVDAIPYSFINAGPMSKPLKDLSIHATTKVNKILQGPRGFIWFATDSGLIRFDGFDSKVYLNDPDKSNSLAHNSVLDMVVDDQGFIYLVTVLGLSRFDPSNEHYLHFAHDPADHNSISSNKINNIQLVADTLWLATDKGINQFNLQSLTNQRVTRQGLPKSSQQQPIEISRLHLDRQNRLWYSIPANGLSLFDQNQQRTAQFKHSNNKQDLWSNLIHRIYQTQDDHIWIATAAGVHRYNPSIEGFDHFELPIKSTNAERRFSVTRFYQDSHGRLWVGTLSNGVSVLLPGHDKFIHLYDGAAGKDNFSPSYITDIYEDSSGLLWFATLNQGIFQLSPNALLFNNWQANPEDPISINSIYQDQQHNIWLGTNKHLYQYKNNQFVTVKPDIGYISAISELENQQLLLAVVHQGLFIYDPLTHQLMPYQHPVLNRHIPLSNYHALARDGAENLWLGLYFDETPATGLYQLNRQNGELIHHLDQFTIESVLPLTDQVVVATRRNGLHLYHRQSKQWQQLTSTEADLSRIWSLYQDSQQRIWVGSNNSGLAQLHLNSMKFSFVTTEQGLPSNTIRSISEDHQGNLWLGTVKGIARYQPQTKTISVFDQRHGSRLTSVYPEMAAVLANGDILMANRDQWVSFTPNRLLQQLHQDNDHAILLSDLRLFNQPLGLHQAHKPSPLSQTLNHTSKLTLSHQQYWFSFKFATSDFNNRHTSRYAYKMEGLSNQWIETDNNNRMVSFTSLPARDYRFSIRTTTADGRWSDNIRHLDITITPPWWQTWPAYLSYLLLLISLGYGLYHWRTQSLQRRAALLERTVNERTDTINELLQQKERMFANISHEFKTPLTLILSPLETIQPQSSGDDIQHKISMIKRNAQRLLRMVEQLLELSRLDSFEQGHKKRFNVKASMLTLLTSFQPLLDHKKLKLNLQYIEDCFCDFSADALEMILTNLLSNAIKYTPEDGQIDIYIQSIDNRAVIKIQDSGLGISAQNQQLVFNRFTRANDAHDEAIPGAGIGLALVKELVEADNGTISLHSIVGQGSTFSLSFPLSDNEELPLETLDHLSTSSQHEIDTLMANDTNHPVVSEQPFEPTNKPTVLLIDDNADMLTLLKQTLEHGYHCLFAPNGTQGLEQATQMIPDLIICDVMMPGISGYEVAKALKQNELTCHIPVVLLTAKGDMSSRMEGWKQDIDDYLPKPFHPQELLLRSQSLLSIRHILKKRFSQSVNLGSTNNTPEPNQITEPVLTDKDKQFIEKFKQVIALNFHDESFNRQQAAQQMLISDRQLHRKLSALLEDNFTEFLRSYRLQKAVELLTTGDQIGQISDKVGFTSMAYFSKCFKAQYNKTPKQYQKEITR